MKIQARWVAVGVFVLSSSLNYLDRQLLAALEPAMRAEFHWNYEDYGRIIGVFSLVYACSAPLMGLFLDRVGLNTGATLSVGLWSLAGIATGWAQALGSLIASRALLGLAQAGGIPSTGKAFATYLQPKERALGTAMNQIGISLGAILAPLIAGTLGVQYGWRAAFIFSGALGCIWIPLWLFTASRTPEEILPDHRAALSLRDVLRQPTYWGFVFANMLAMTAYSLWTNWTTSFLVTRWHLAQADANRTLAWIPPLVGITGGILGGLFSMQLAKGGLPVAEARRRAVLAGALLLMAATAFVPFAPSPLLATFGIALSFFGSTFLSVNLYALPLDVYGPARAGFAIASLTFAYGAMQAAASPLIGRVVDREGFTPVCLGVALLPVLAAGILYATRET